MKRILYLSYDGMTDPLGQSQVLPYICGLAKLGFHFTLISCEKPGRFELHKAAIQHIASQYNIDWQPIPYTKKPAILSTIRDINRMEKLALGLHKKDPFSMVHCRGHVPSLVGLNLKRTLGVKFLFDMRGFWADEKVDAGAWRLSNPVYRMVYTYFKKKEKAFLEKSDHIICLTQKALDEMQTWKHTEVRPESITIIPCCVDTDLFNRNRIFEADREALRKELNLSENNLVISYLGSIGTWYMLEEMLDFFVSFKKHKPFAKFLFITQDEHERILNRAREKGLEAMDIVLRPAKRTEVPLVLSLSDYSLFFIRPTYSKISSSPTKQGEIMAMGIPVICNAGVGDTDMVVERYGSGVLIKEMKPDLYEKAIDILVKTSFDANHIRSGALDFFSLEEGVARYAKVYREIFKTTPDSISLS